LCGFKDAIDCVYGSSQGESESAPNADLTVRVRVWLELWLVVMYGLKPVPFKIDGAFGTEVMPFQSCDDEVIEYPTLGAKTNTRRGWGTQFLRLSLRRRR
jgi:hypothetical protein